MITAYIYVLDTLADWEIGYLTAELHSKRFFKKDAPELTVKTVGITGKPVKTMGGLTIVPDCTINDIQENDKTVLILPGSNEWLTPKHTEIIKEAQTLLSCGATVCAICGATAALANAGVLNNRPHTSNGPGFLKMVAPNYTGEQFYIDEPSVADTTLFTAGCTGGLLWAKQIIEHLHVFNPETLQAWHNYFLTGKTEHYIAMMKSSQS